MSMFPFTLLMCAFFCKKLRSTRKMCQGITLTFEWIPLSSIAFSTALYIEPYFGSWRTLMLKNVLQFDKSWNIHVPLIQLASTMHTPEHAWSRRMQSVLHAHNGSSLKLWIDQQEFGLTASNALILQCVEEHILEAPMSSKLMPSNCLFIHP
ncbi:hypothetical protein BJ741DRAFT_607678 [Chytriomyces cf. hyalinus JEL632]|nr:hypothetical protein BJ741DRAFT_607678 [Chytriomyces cf. hyalinus JEL632]